MVSQQLIEIIIKAQDQASETAKKVDENLKRIGKSSNLLGNVPGINTLKTKLGNIAQTIDGKLGGALTKARNKFTSFGTKLSNIGSTLKTKVGGAIDGVRAKMYSLVGSTQSASRSLGFLKSAASMAVGMIGYDLFNSLVETTRASLNARSSIQAFASRLNMSKSEVDTFQKSLDNLQNTYKKIDMDVVGKQATDMAYRLGLPKTSLTELTETTAIFTDAMQRNGRSAEDSMLAMSDAMDGQFVRLKELGINQKDLMNNGWDGDINNKTGLLHAMNKALKEQHYDELAKSVDNLDDAWTVLTVTLSNLLEKILVPLTPLIVGVVNAFADAVGGIMDFVGAVQSAWSAMPDWGKAASLITGVTIAVGALATVISSKLFGAVARILIQQGIATAETVGLMVAEMGLSGAFGVLATATWSAVTAMVAFAAPILAVVAVIGVLVYAIYEVGKAFGWWTDIGSMVDAIGDGLKRMWDAFVNHPDVQGVISWLGYAFKTLGSWLTQAGQAVMQFFGISTGSKWDIVKDIISAIGGAWSILSAPIRGAITVLQMAWSFLSGLVGPAVNIGQAIYNALKPIVCILLGCSPGIVPALTKVQDVFTTVWGFISGIVGGIVNGIVSSFTPMIDLLTQIGQFISGAFLAAWNYMIFVIQTVIGTVRSVIGVFQLFLNGQISLPQAIMLVLQLLFNAYNTIYSRIMRLVIKFAAQMLSKAIQTGKNFVNGIISHLKQLPGKAYSALIAVVSKIVSAGAKWVSNAKSQANKVKNGVYSALSGTASKVTSALSGVANAILKPFKQGYEWAKQKYDQIKNMVSNIPGLGGAGGYDDVDDFGGYGGEIMSSSNNTTHKVSGEITIIHYLKNLPNSSDEKLIAKLINDSFENDIFVKKLAENMKFQKYDLNVKNRIKARNNRARGV